jgi:hypothetical protein
MQSKQLQKHPNHPPDERINILTQLCIASCATTFLSSQFTRHALSFGGFTCPAPPFGGLARHASSYGGIFLQCYLGGGGKTYCNERSRVNNIESYNPCNM